MIARLTARYLAVFAVVLAALSGAAFALIALQYHDQLAPVLQTPQGQAAYVAALQRVALMLLAIDLPLLIVVGTAALLLARASLSPLIEAREAERRFAADAAHELRSPLATIAAVAQAHASSVDGEAKDAFDLIAASALDASTVVAELLTLARDPRPELLQREPVDLAAVARSVAREFTQRASSQRITLDLDVSSAIVNGDERRLREAARNLIDNALRYARSRITIEVASRRTVAELVVNDDGPGVPEPARAEIFKRFFRVDPTTATGSGLGLSIVRWVAQAHGGTVALESTHGTTGARFVVRLPLLPDASHVHAPPK